MGNTVIMETIYPNSDDLNENENFDEIRLAREIMNNPPKGAWKREELGKIIIGSTTRSAIAFFLVPFMTVWSGGAIGGIYVSQIINGEFNLFLSLFGIPFLAGSIIFWSVALMAIGGKVEVVIGKESYVFTGLGKIGIKRKFDWNSIVRIYEERSRGRHGHSSSIYMEGKTRVEFGNGLSEERKYFLITTLKYLHSKKRHYIV